VVKRLLCGVALVVWGAARAEKPQAPEPPPGVRCLARHFTGKPEQREGRWGLLLPGGTFVPWDDGREKSFEEQLDAPDLEDTLSQPYPTGPIQPVTRENEDPGRIRVDALFRATYGQRREEVRVVDFRLFGQTLKVHRKALPAFERVRARLEKLVAADPSLKQYLQGVGGTFNWRPIAGTTRQSAHSYGVSIDLNVARSHYWQWQKPPRPLRWRNQIPQVLVDAFEAEGFIWGGRWYHYDTMHFEWRPELFDAECRPR
jgi:hypothetical protein